MSISESPHSYGVDQLSFPLEPGTKYVLNASFFTWTQWNVTYVQGMTR